MARLTGNAVNALPVAEVIVTAAATAVDVAVAADSGDGMPTLSSAAIDVLRSNDEVRIGNCIVKYGTDDVGTDDPNSVAAADAVEAAAADVNGLLANNWLYSWNNFELWKYSGMYLLYSYGIKCVLLLLLLLPPPLQLRGDALLRHNVFTAAATTTGE